MGLFSTLTGGDVVGAGLSVLNNLFGVASQDSAQDFNAREAEKNRQFQARQLDSQFWYNSQLNKQSQEFQSEQSRIARDWEEEMYNLYNSPSAMMAQYKKAGLNPYLGASGQTGAGMGTSAPLSGSPAQTGVGLPSGAQASAPGVFRPSLAADYASIAGVNAQSANQRSQALSNTVRTLLDAYKEGGSKMFDKLLGLVTPELFGSDPESSESIKMMRSQRYNIDMNSLNEEFQYITSKYWTFKEKQAAFENVTAQTKNLLFDLILKSSQKELNDKELHVYASQIARNFADAFNLKKQGQYYEASASQVNIMNEMLNLQLQDQLADFYGSQGIRTFKYTPEYIKASLGLFKGEMNTLGYSQQTAKTNAAIEGNKVLRYMREITGDIGNIIKVNLSSGTSSVRSRSDINSRSRSDVNIRTYGEYNNVTPTEPRHIITGF